MSTTVEISVDDDGNVSVGLTDAPSDSSQMQPANNVADALAMAKHLLNQPGGSGQMSGQTPGTQGDTATSQQGTPNGMGGGTGPDSDGSTVQSTQGPDVSSTDGKNQSAQQMWDMLAQMNMPQD